jgi:hypothetical protein
MTTLTISVESDLEFLDLALVLCRAMALAALLNLLALIPNIFTIFIDVMAILAFHLIVLGMTEV